MKLMHITTFLVLTSLAQPSLAGWFNRKKETGLQINVVESTEQAAAKLEALKKLQEEMSSKFTSIEWEIERGNSSAALNMAKQVLDTVRVKTGIDPKVRIQENFLVPTKFSSDAASFNDLNEDQRYLVIRTISDFRAGLYMDIMNLSKRTSLLYIKAFQAQLQKNGGLTNEDKNKIITDLVKASLVPMPVVDKSGKKIFVFDEDVANEDHTYLFNRELKLFLISNQALALSEEEFDELKTQLRQEIIGVKASGTASLANGWKCLKDAAAIEHYNSRVQAQISCFNKHYQKSKTMEECKNLAAEIEYYNSRVESQLACYNKFN